MAPCFWWIFTHLQCHPKDGVFGRMSVSVEKMTFALHCLGKSGFQNTYVWLEYSLSNTDFVCIGRHGIYKWHLGKLHKLQYCYMPLGEKKTCYNSITQIRHIINVNLSSYYSTHPLVLAYSVQVCVCTCMSETAAHSSAGPAKEGSIPLATTRLGVKSSPSKAVAVILNIYRPWHQTCQTWTGREGM